MSHRPKKEQLGVPTTHNPNVVVDEILDKQVDYSQFDTGRVQIHTQTTTIFVESEVGGKHVVERTPNIVVDEFLDHTIKIPPPKPKEPYVYTGKGQPPQRKHGKHLTKQQQQEAERAYQAELRAHFAAIKKSGHIEDEVFAPGTGEEKHQEVGERGAATRHTANIMVDDILDGRMGRKPPITRNTVTVTTKQQTSGRSTNKSTNNLRVPQISPDKASDLSQIEVSTSIKNACLFLRLVMKKKEQTQSGLVFSRLLLRNQKGKLLKNRILSLASMFNHLKAKKINIGFTTMLAAGWKRSQNLRQPLSPTMSRQKQITGSTSRLPRTSRNRLEVREKSSASLGLDEEKEEEKRMMALSEQAKEAILKMQRFDRYIYPFESEKHLKVPIENELRRLEKIKSANKSMWNTYYDNELTITCLYNHMKNLYELNRDLSQIDLLKGQNEELEKRIIETNVQKQKEINEAKKNRGGDGSNENTVLKEYQRNTEFLISTLNETNEKARKLLQTQLKKATSPHKELLEVTLDMVNELIQLQEGTSESVTMQTLLTKLTQEQTDSTRTIQYLERQKKVIEKSISDAKTDETRNMNTSLLNVCSYLISLHGKLKILKGQGSSRNFQKDPNELGRLRSDLQNERNKIRDLQNKIQQLNKEKRALEDMKDITVLTTWETQLTQIIEKSETKEPYQGDIGKQRKLLTVRKDNKYNSIISLNLTLLENMLKKDRQIEKLERQIQDRPATQANPNKQVEEKYNKEKQRAETAEAEIARLTKQLEEFRQKDKSRDKDPLQNELLELFKICTLLEQAITKRDTETGTGVNTTTPELQKARKTLETRKRVSQNLLPVINIMESLLRIILDTQAAEKKRQQQEEKFELQRTKELTGIDAFTRSLMKLIEAEGLRVDDGLINRLRKNLDVTMSKLQKGADSPVSDLYDMYRNVVEVNYRFVGLLEATMKAAKEDTSASGSQKVAAQNTDRKLKQQEESFTKRIQQLEKQLEIEKGRFSTRDQEMNRLKDAEDTLTKRVQQLEKQLEIEKGRMTTREQELANRQQELKKLRADLQAKEQELKTIRSELTSRDTELRRVTTENTKKGELDIQLKTQRETIQMHVESERNLNKRIGELERGENESKRQINDLQKQISDLQKQIATLQKQYNDSTREANELQKLNNDANRQIAELSKQFDQNTKQTTDGKSRVKELSDQISDLNRQIRQLTTQNNNLSNTNKELISQNKELNGQIRQLSAQIKDLNNQIRDLNSEMTDLNTREAESLKTISDLRRNLEQSSSKINQQNQQTLDKLRQEKMQLQYNINELNRQLNNLSGKDSNNSLQLKNLNRDLQTANRNLKQRTDEWEREQRESQRLRDELQRLKDQLQRLKDDSLRSKNDSRQVDTANRNLKQKIDDLERQQRESQKLRDELQRFKEQSIRSKNQKNQNNIELTELRNTIVILENRIRGFESNINQIKFLQQANKSLKDENDALRMELLQRNKSFQPQTNTADSAKLQSVTSELSRLQSDYSRLKAEHDKSSGLSSSETVTLKAEVKRLNSVINSNEEAFNKMVNENQVLLNDNQTFFNDINTLKQREIQQTRLIQDLELRISQVGRSTDNNSATLRSEFNSREAKYLEQIRVLKQQKGILERQLQTRQSSQELIKSLTDKESRVRAEKSDVDRELILRNSEINDLKNRLSRLTSDSSQVQTSQIEISRVRSEFTVKEDSLKRTIRELQIKESDLKRLIDNNSSMYNQNQQRLNSEISSLRAQLVSRQRQYSDLKRNQSNLGVDRDLQDARLNYNKLQAEKLANEQLYQKRKKDYEVILLELETQHDKTDQLERANERIQRQLAEVETRFEMQSRQLERVKSGTIVGELTSPNSRYMMLMEEKKSVEIEYSKLKSVFDKESSFRKELQDKFTIILHEKTKFLEKIDVLQRTVHAKQLDLLKNYEAREENLRDLISENKKMQRELKSINDKLSAQHKISTKSLEQNLSKLETDLSKLRRQNATLRDEIQDLQDELAERSRTKTPQRPASKLLRVGCEQDNDDKYLLKVDGDRMREQIYYLECSNEKLKQKIRGIEDASVHSVRSGGDSYRRISHSRVLGDDRMGSLNDKLTEKVKYLQRERHTLYQRLKILSIFSRIDSPNHAFIHNLNRVLDNILVFLNESEEFSESIITYGNFISQISQSVSADNYERYFQNVEDFLKDLFLRTFESKNEILAKQAGQLIHFREQMSDLVNEQIDYIEEEERATPKSTYSRRNDFDRVHYSEPAGMASFIALQHLFRLYVRAKSPQVLDEIAQLLNITQMGLQEGQA